MPIYEFQSSDGDRIERVFSMRRVPASVTVRGKRYKRIVSSTVQALSNFKPYATVCAPKRVPGFPHDKKGRVILQSRADEHRLAKAVGCVME